MAQSTGTTESRKGSRPERPDKPYADYPLFPHAAGSWAKKINGKLFYFGGWANDPNGEEALAKYKWQKEGLERGIPQSELTEPMSLDQMEEAHKSGDGLTVKWLCNRFLHKTEQRMKLTGKPSLRTFNDYKKVCERMRDILGASKRVSDLKVDDFDKMAVELGKGEPGSKGNRKDLSPTTRGNYIIRTRRVFQWAAKTGVIPSLPNFGELYQRSSTEEVDDYREEKERENGSSMIEADVLRLLIEKAEQPLKAMILLAANCGFGNKDCSELRRDIIDLDGGWIKLHRRGKSKKPRKAKLWPETVAAIREAQASRPAPASKEDSDRLFLTAEGLPLVRTGPSGKSNINTVSSLFDGLLKELKIKRNGLSFYGIRHGYYTTATGSFDTEACKLTMGHAIPGMGRHYIEARAEQWDERLSRVADHVHKWLWPDDLAKK